jgi:tRNA A-37 threonylcarbamoyl transferase component Bud32
VNLEKISTNQLHSFLLNSQIIEQDAYGPKVALLNDGLFLKVLRRKKSWKANEVAKIKRFCNHADELKKRSIPTLEPLRMLQIAEQKKAAVIYKPLEGTPLRKVLGNMSADEIERAVAKLAAFINTLHARGIYFRSLHADNILVIDGNSFGLIDILDMQFSKKPLSIFKRSRNFQHLFRLNNLNTWHEKIIHYYINAAGLSGWKKSWLIRQSQPFMNAR